METMNVLERIVELDEMIEALKAERKALAESLDERAGEMDCRLGVYDKYFRYNREDDGAAYDKGWMNQNKVTQCETVQFIC